MNGKDLPRLLILLSLVTIVAPGPHRRRVNPEDRNRPCSLMDYASTAECQQTDYRLSCRFGISSEWTKEAKYEITQLRVLQWPGECFNISRLQLHFPDLRQLEFINCTKLNTFKGQFDNNSTVEKIKMRGLTSLWEVPAEMVVLMPELAELDFRSNVLRHMKARLLRDPPRLERVYLSDNKWDCSDDGLDWLALEPANGTVRRKIVDYYKLMCHQQLYRGKPLHKVMDIIRTVRKTCPKQCACQMTNVVSDRAGGIIPLITANCADLDLVEPPEILPPSTTTLRLEGNKINTIRNIIQNPRYRKLVDLYLDNNSISSIKELEGSEWFSAFRVLSLRGNMLKQIPVYAFDQAFQGNNNIMHVFLGHNPWRCDCHFVPRFQGLLLKYKRVIQDLQDIRCSKSDDKTISLAQISTIPLGNVCRSGVEMPISPINILNITLTALLLLVLGRFLYDWHSFRTTGSIPGFRSIL